MEFESKDLINSGITAPMITTETSDQNDFKIKGDI